MSDKITRLDVLHEAAFSQPAFELVREAPSILKRFYEALGTRFRVDTAYTTVNSTNTLHDLIIRIGLFNNVAAVELTPDRMTINFPNITNRNDVVLVKETLSLAHDGLAAALPNTTLSTSKFTLNMWVAMEGGAAATEAILSKHAIPTKPLDVSKWGATSSRHGLRLTTSNDAEGWSLTIYGEPSLVPGSHLFLSFDFAVQKASSKTIAEQLVLAEQKLPQIFEALGLNFPAETTNAQ